MLLLIFRHATALSLPALTFTPDTPSGYAAGAARDTPCQRKHERHYLRCRAFATICRARYMPRCCFSCCLLAPAFQDADGLYAADADQRHVTYSAVMAKRHTERAARQCFRYAIIDAMPRLILPRLMPFAAGVIAFSFSLRLLLRRRYFALRRRR